jgi:hypothetical protein
MFVACANTGTGARIMTSPDGINWMIRNTPADNSWLSVCWSPELSIFVAVAETGAVNRVMSSKPILPASKSAVLANASQFMVDYITGNIGISTTSPTQKLQVVGNATVSGTVSASNIAGSGSSLSNLNASFITSGTINSAYLPSTISVSSISADGSSLSNLNATLITSGTLANARLPSSISVATISADGATLSNLNATYLTSGTLANARLPPAFNVATTSQSLTINASGNVGVGTNNPSQLLHVAGNILSTGTITASNLVVIGDVVTLNTVTSNTENMVINNAGTGPALKVIQSGNNTVAEFYDAEVGAPALMITNNGNVGIGTTNPLQKLQVEGSINLTGDLYRNNELIRTATYGLNYNSQPVIYTTLTDTSGYHSNLYEFAAQSNQYITFGSNAAVSSNAIYDGAIIFGASNTVFHFTPPDPAVPASLEEAFTYEAWVYTNSQSYLSFTANSLLVVVNGNVVGASMTTTYGLPFINVPISYNSWTHFAFNMTDQNLYVNGVLMGSIGAWSFNINSIQDMLITARNIQVSNLRLTRNANAYTTNFTPSTSPLTPLAGTRLLMRAPPVLVTPNVSSESNLFVGIGTSTPLYKLEVVGEIYSNSNVYGNNVLLLQQGTAATPAITWNQDKDTGIYNPTSNQLAVAVGGAESLRVTSTGIGIGTTNPVAKLDVREGIYGSTLIGGDFITVGVNKNNNYESSLILISQSNQSSGYNNSTRLTRYNTGETALVHYGTEGFYMVANNAAQLYFQTNGLTPMTINSAGNVGFGTLTPSYKIDVYDTTNTGIALTQINNTDGLVYSGRRARGTTVPQVVQENDRLTAIHGSGYNGTAYTESGTISIHASETYGATSNGSYIRFSNTSNGSTTSTETLRIAHDGNVGIGTTLPLRKLHVQGDINFSGSLYQNNALYVSSQWTTGVANALYYTDGNVGIGTTIANYKLQVNGKIFASDSITAYSDARVKTDVYTLTNALNTVSQLRGVGYTRADTGEKQIGVIAQEVQSILPEVVTEAENGLSVAYGNIVGVLIEAVKELTERVKHLESQPRCTCGSYQ